MIENRYFGSIREAERETGIPHMKIYQKLVEKLSNMQVKMKTVMFIIGNMLVREE